MKNINPALKDLEPFVGKWDMELSNAAFLPDPKATVHADVSFEWIENGAFFAMSQGNNAAPERAIWVIGRDDKEKNYTILYSDARGVSRIYEMSFEKNVWKIWRNSPGFSQRYEGKVSKDKKTITAHWEKSFDGKKWEHDFDLKYAKNRR